MCYTLVHYFAMNIILKPRIIYIILPYYTSILFELQPKIFHIFLFVFLLLLY